MIILFVKLSLFDKFSHVLFKNSWQHILFKTARWLNIIEYDYNTINMKQKRERTCKFDKSKLQMQQIWLFNQFANIYLAFVRIREYIHYTPMQLHIPFSKSSGKMTRDLHFRARNVRHFYKAIREKISRFYVWCQKQQFHHVLVKNECDNSIIFVKNKVIEFLFKKKSSSLILFFSNAIRYSFINDEIYIDIEILKLLSRCVICAKGKSDTATCRHVLARTYVFRRILITYYDCICSVCAPCTPSSPEVLSSQFPRRIAKWF